MKRLGCLAVLVGLGCSSPALTCRLDDECLAGQRCHGGVCVAASDAAIAPVDAGCACPAREVCARGLCFPTDCADLACREVEFCAGSNCIVPDCVGVVCAAGSLCVAGSCRARDCATPCGPHEFCSQGVCVDVLCEGVVCQGAAVCVAGRCVAPDCATPCGPGEVCDQDRCLARECVDVLCPEGERCVAARCVAGVPDAGSSPADAGRPDAGASGRDAGTRDGGSPDASASSPDAGPETRACTVAHGTGLQTLGATGWGPCLATACEPGYRLDAGACLAIYQQHATSRCVGPNSSADWYWFDSEGVQQDLRQDCAAVPRGLACSDSEGCCQPQGVAINGHCVAYSGEGGYCYADPQCALPLTCSSSHLCIP